MCKNLLLIGLSCCLFACSSLNINPFRLSNTTDSIEQKKHTEEIRLSLASSYLQNGNPNAALEVVDELLRTHPRSAQALGLKALVLEQLGLINQAETHFQNALRIEPNNPDLLHNFAWHLCQAGRYAESAGLFRSALEMPSYQNRAKTFLTLGICEQQSGKLTEALNALGMALRLTPNNLETLYRYAGVLAQLRNYNEALLYIQQVNNAAAIPVTLLLQVNIHQALGQNDAAIKVINELQQRFPNSQEARGF